VLKPLKDYLPLKDLNVTIEKGSFVCIIGDVGSGKSSLFSAMIGDMIYLPQKEIDTFGGVDKEAKKDDFDTLRKRLLSKDLKFDSPVKVDGSMSYVEQNAWIQNCTIRDNILFNKPMDRQRYINTIIACQLESDLGILPAGDMTEIGEKGINLSGGQKARISLARAVYADNDVVLMDDPISALDANVRKLIFKEVFQGMLKTKTRVLVTHAVDFLHLTDKIIVMKGGKVQANGSFEELQSDPHLIEVLDIYKK
jgi:ABC-type bacteriocin/lantibiotic exporter with double-glycine peptidase domain